MRQIEYRAWHRREQRMVGWRDKVESDEWRTLCQCVYSARPALTSLILLEFTQARDNNDVKIFEGDIVRDGNGLRFKIEYRKDLYRFVLCSLDGRRVVRSSLDAYHNIEVIGNVYEPHNGETE